MTITQEVNMITRKMTLFFSSTLWFLSVIVFHFCVSRPSKFNFCRVSLCIMFWSVKYQLTCQKWHLLLITHGLFMTTYYLSRHIMDGCFHVRPSTVVLFKSYTVPLNDFICCLSGSYPNVLGGRRFWNR